MKKILYKFMRKAVNVAVTSKKRMLISLAILSFIIPDVARGEEIFSDLTNQKQVESTYVSGRFSHNMKRWLSQSGLHSMDLSRGFSSLYTYQCYSIEATMKARSILDNYVAKHKNMELMMRTKQLQGEYLIYEMFNNEDAVTQMIIWDSASPGLCEIVVVNWKEGLKRNTPQ